MVRRITVALGVFLSCIGAAMAQPTETPATDQGQLTSVATEQGPLSSFLPAPRGRFWFSADYLFAFMRGSNLPALVTTSDAGTAKINAGVVGAAGSSTLFGSGWVNDDLRAGMRLQGGYWFHPEGNLGVETGFMLLEGQAAHFIADANAFPILARPFINANTGAQSSTLIAFPGSSIGSVNARASSANFYGANIDLAEKAYDDGFFQLTSVFGYRYYRYDEGVQVNQVITPTGPTFVPGTQVLTNDNIYTRNEFHGLDMGFRSRFVWERASLEFLTKVAVGRVFRVVNIGGDQTILVPGAAPIFQQAGLLASGTNSGYTSTSDWKVMPEAGVAISWQLRPNVNLRLGYSFLLLNGVARAADKVDTTVNPNFLPGGNAALGGEARPANNNNRVDMWIQSINVGLVWNY